MISAATITDERAEIVNFSDPYFNAGQMIAVRADETEISGPGDLAGKKVGVQLGTTGDIWLTEETEAEVVRFDENTLAFQALANGDVDAAVADGPTAIDIVKANPEMGLTVLDGVYTEESYGIAVNMEQTEFLARSTRGWRLSRPTAPMTRSMTSGSAPTRVLRLTRQEQLVPRTSV